MNSSPQNPGDVRCMRRGCRANSQMKPNSDVSNVGKQTCNNDDTRINTAGKQQLGKTVRSVGRNTKLLPIAMMSPRARHRESH